MNERSTDGWRTEPRLRKTRTIVLNEGDPEAKREEIRRYFHDTYDIDEALLEMLRYDETFYLRADPLRHPLIFYFGHTACFFINKLILGKIITERVNPAFEAMFAVGVDEMSWDDLNEAHYDWPTVADVQAYRDRVREVVDEVISTMPLDMPITWSTPWWVIMMGIEHARIHLETSSVLIRQLPIEHVRPHPLFPICTRSGDAPANELLDVSPGRVTMAKHKDNPLYGWDNEFGSHGEDVTAHRAAKYLVSNREFLAFVEDGAYGQEQYWTEEGWNWRTYKQAEHPLFWIEQADGTYRFRTVAEEIDMPWDWPVEVNYLEAKAFCNWKSERDGKKLRLPTEAEWRRLRDVCIDADVPRWKQKTDQPYWDVAPGNINLEHYASSCPVTEFAFGDFCDVIGNVWQWTETPIDGFESFDVHPCYDDFSTPTFDGKHNLIKGGSWISTGNEATRDARYAFRRHFFQHAGFRYIESEHEPSILMRQFETDELVARYADSQYGKEHFGAKSFSRTLARLCKSVRKDAISDRSSARVLDIGCATGRTTFELACEFNEVMGLDTSARLIRFGTELKEHGVARYTAVEEGENVSYHEVKLADLRLPPGCGRVDFQQADACNLKPIYKDYDLVVAENIIERIYSPRRFLGMIHERINPGGLLVIASTYAWDHEVAEMPEWLGGYRDATGEPVRAIDSLHECLDPNFTLEGKPADLPFFLRETARVFKYCVSEVTVWRRNA